MIRRAQVPLIRRFVVVAVIAATSVSCGASATAPGGVVGPTPTGSVQGPARIDVLSHVSTALPSTRALRVYLPPGYDSTSTRRYPVIYFQPGANGFVASRSVSSSTLSWGLDTTLTSLIHSGQVPPMIVVGIDQLTQGVITEYTPPTAFCYPVTVPNPIPAALGDKYATMVISEIKPAIDAAYRTMPGQSTTGMLGSSAAGMESFFTVITNTNKFGLLGFLSAATCAGERISQVTAVNSLAAKPALRVFLGVGGSEVSGTLVRMQDLYNAMIAKGWVQATDVRYDTVALGGHNEQTWSIQSSQILRFLFH